MLISDNTLYELELDILFSTVLGGYDLSGETEVSQAQWEAILTKSAEIGGKAAECILEADRWVRDTFKEYEVFTMVGI